MDMNSIEPILGALMGLGLAAACGFRVFVPLLIISVAQASGHVTLGQSFEWMGSPVAMVMFGTATILEISAYYIPWLDNALDTISTPAAVVAGSIVTAACITDMSPMMTWGTAVIAGGGTAAATQTFTVASRAVSTAVTGGVANPVVSSTELAASGGVAVLAVIWPVVTVILAAVVVVAGGIVVTRFRQRRLVAAAAGDTPVIDSASAA